jgi:23S rRNA (cytosine1962-C5)-methyltransferase
LTTSRPDGPALVLRSGRERALLQRHPWVFSGAVAEDRSAGAAAGDTVRVLSSEGRTLALAALSPSSDIRARVWTLDTGEAVDAAFLRRRIETALTLRRRLGFATGADASAARLVHGEADGLPGLVVDRYGDALCAQFGGAGVHRWKGELLDALEGATGLQRIFERGDAVTRKLEGLPALAAGPGGGWLRGGGDPRVVVREHGLALQVDLAEGHKTGAYLDQRDNRRAFGDYVARFSVRKVLNCFAYSGGFSVAALKAGADEVVSVDSSAAALELCRANVQLNAADPTGARHSAVEQDVGRFLRAALAAGSSYDAVVLDPPKYARTRGLVDKAARAYKDINMLALKLLNPGGLLFTFSCSGAVSPDLFHKVVAGAAIDAGVAATVLDTLGPSSDHPRTLFFPEGWYLKGLVLMRMG